MTIGEIKLLAIIDLVIVDGGGLVWFGLLIIKICNFLVLSIITGKHNFSNQKTLENFKIKIII